MGNFRLHELLTDSSIQSMMPQLQEYALRLGYHYDTKGLDADTPNRGWIPLEDEDFEIGRTMLHSYVHTVWRMAWQRAKRTPGLPKPFTHIVEGFVVSHALRTLEFFTPRQIDRLSTQVRMAMFGSRLMASVPGQKNTWFLRDFDLKVEDVRSSAGGKQNQSYRAKLDRWADAKRVKEETRPVSSTFKVEALKLPNWPDEINQETLVDYVSGVTQSFRNAYEAQSRRIDELQRERDKLADELERRATGKWADAASEIRKNLGLPPVKDE